MTTVVHPFTCLLCYRYPSRYPSRYKCPSRYKRKSLFFLLLLVISIVIIIIIIIVIIFCYQRFIMSKWTCLLTHCNMSVFVTFVDRRHIVVSTATGVDDEISEAFPVAGRLRVTIEVAQLSFCHTIAVWGRQVGLLQHQRTFKDNVQWI